ncbi:MAG: SUMF1/EgtB/PvdO family nonheme iron enzyme [Chromatiales bacterium]|nr:SUMF1/EgtB/PvdO family nonheme iron enzyme [Chromatiales bacterium]
MSESRNKHSLWRVVSLYAAISWVCLQVIDVVTQNIGLPKWVFMGTLGLLLAGLPVAAATAYFQANPRRPVSETGSAPGYRLGRFLQWRHVWKAGIGVLAAWGVAVTGWMLLSSQENLDTEWDLVTGLDEIRRLAGEFKYPEANKLAKELDGLIENDAIRDSMWAQVSQKVVFETRPPGARVLRRDYESTAEQWEELGTTPLDVEHFPKGLSRVRFELQGYLPRETARYSSGFARAAPFVLDTPESIPEGMIRVSGETASIMAPGLEQLKALALGDFFMDKHELTNRQYKEFVDAGGYADPACWRHLFVREGQTLSFEQAMSEFVDKTGRPGPSGWEVGAYPEGQEDFPVGGVSWYEADAYACFAGKALPSVYHWYMAADPFSSNHVVPLSNFDRKGPAPVGQYKGITRDGVYDMAGNVREWTGNPDGEAHYILGGGWSDPAYAFNDPVSSPNFDRSPENGLRLVTYPDATNVAEANRELEKAFRDYYTETPVSDEVFEVYRQVYAYDHKPLNAVVLSTEETGGYTRQRIEMDAAYGDERLTVFVFLPASTQASAPLQAVTYFPGSGDLYKRSLDELDVGRIEFILRSGRAVVYPIYKGTFNRGSELTSDVQDASNLYRDHVIAWSRDLGRTIDYLETRPDIDAERLAYYGISWGGVMGAIMTAVEPRLKASVLIVGGLEMQDVQPVADPFNFLPRVVLPTLMINGRYDSFFPLEASIKPFFKYLGTPEADKKLIVTDSNHFVLAYSANLAIRESLDWMDRYLGPVK